MTNPGEQVLLSRVRRAALAVVLVAAAGVFLNVVHHHYPIQKWLFWHYALPDLAVGVVLASFLVAGHTVTRRALGTNVPLLEHLTLSFAVGLYVFEASMFLLGLLGLWHRATFFVLPLGLLAIFGYPAWKSLRRVGPRLLSLSKRSRRLTTGKLVMIAFGLAVLALIYFYTLTPHNVQFDSRWKHLTLAENYAARGGVTRFGEGWFFGARPHFTSYLYGWAFLAPTSLLFDRIILCAHLEFWIFTVGTVLGVSAAVRRLFPSADPRVVWVARFLFPGVLLYDSSLSVGADHIGAILSLPIFLMTMRCFRRPSAAACGLFSVLLAAAVLTKETVAFLLVPFPVAVVVVGIVRSAVRRFRGRLPEAQRWDFLAGPAAAVVGSLLLTAPMWLKNWVWYGDPMYPMLQGTFHGRPWTPDAAYLYRWYALEYEMWRPPPGLDGWIQTAKVLFTFSFDPHDYKQFHGTVPVFGSLFTLLLATLPFLKRTRWAWVLVLWIHLSIAAWFNVHHQDRYLQGLAPLMAVVVAFALSKVWRSSRWITRSALMGLVGLQIVWGGDVYFFGTHAMTGSPAKRVMDLIQAGFKKNYEHRFDFEQSYVAIGKTLPKNAVVLRHEVNDHLGLGVASVADSRMDQFGLSYGLMASTQEVYRALRDLGVTHVMWRTRSAGADTLAGDLRFFDFVENDVVDRKAVAGWYVAKLPPEAPKERKDERVLALTCSNRPATGVYRLEDLRVPSFGPERTKYPAPRRPGKPEEARELIQGVSFVVMQEGCRIPFTPAPFGFVMAAKRIAPNGTRNPHYALWVKKLPR
ncbi:MAG: hypothetical protein KC776_28775 [Myxococcales bacterium]|nr:hypothetical protein [Myxococcales bacterium]MCB9579942.1 hypothetical protein [Polyangiaceae bacterium]